MEDILSLLGQYAFPIVACIAMGWYVKYIQDNYRKDIQELLGHDSVRASVDTIKFLLSKYEGFWKFNDSAIRINHIKDLLNI